MFIIHKCKAVPKFKSIKISLNDSYVKICLDVVQFANRWGKLIIYSYCYIDNEPLQIKHMPQANQIMQISNKNKIKKILRTVSCSQIQKEKEYLQRLAIVISIIAYYLFGKFCLTCDCHPGSEMPSTHVKGSSPNFASNIKRI